MQCAVCSVQCAVYNSSVKNHGTQLTTPHLNDQIKEQLLNKFSAEFVEQHQTLVRVISAHEVARRCHA